MKLLLLLLIMIPGIDGKGFIGPLTLSLMLSFIVLFIFLFAKLNQQSANFTYPPLIVFYVFSLAALGILSSKNTGLYMMEVKSLFLGLIFAIVLFTAVKTTSKKDLLFVLRAALFVCCILSLMQAIAGFGFISTRTFQHTFFNGMRANGLMDDPNYFGLYILTIGSALILLERKNILLYALVIMFICFLSGSRSMLLVSILQLCSIVTYIKFNGSKTLSIIVGSCLLAILFTLKPYLPNAVASVFDISKYSSDAERNSLAHRAGSTLFAFQKISEKPILGHGPRSLQEFDNGVYSGNSHNSVVEILVSYGIFGLGCYMAIFYLTYSKIRNLEAKKFYEVFLFTIFVGNLFLVNYYLKSFFLAITLLFIGVYFDTKNTASIRRSRS